MRAKTSVFIAASLDGFIARKDGSLDWLDEANKSVPEGEDCGYLLFMESVDALVMGRKTFEKVLSFGEWGYGKKEVIVLSSSAIDIPDFVPDTVRFLSASPEEVVLKLSEEGKKHLYIDGGNTIQRFLNEGFIDELTITLIPVLLGEGISLFSKVNKDISLSHVDTISYHFGFVQLKYKRR